MDEKSNMIINNRGLRTVLVAIGCCSTALAIIGIFLPLLPTVPLLLLAAACFARSSERFYFWLVDHPRLGPMVSGYLDGRGIPLKAKITAIALIWLSIPMTALFFIGHIWGKIALMILGICLTIYLLRLPLSQPEG